MDEIVIKVANVGKDFKLPHEKQSSVKSLFINAFRKKTYEQQNALKNISFEVKKGEFFGIVGRNGSGKSTLLKLLAGIYSTSRGHIQVNGQLTPFIELGVGFNPELSGRDNVYLNGALLGFKRKEMDAMYDEIVAFAELDRFMDQKLKNYSSGMHVRLAFSIATRVKSDILLIDEVLAVGDAAFQRKCYDYFMLLKKNNHTVILVTHDMGAVRQYCDRALMIENGKVVERGDPEDVAQAYQKLFIKEQKADGVGTEKESTKNNHWGTGKIKANSPQIKAKEDYITINSTFTAKVDTPPPIYGFTIYGPSGKNILEGNTLRMKHKTNTVLAGNEVQLTWKIPNIFATGTYDVSVACCNESATEFYDWFNEAGSFIVNKEGNTAGAVDPPLIIEKFSVVNN